MINKCHPSWQAKQLNSIHPSNKTWFKCFFLFSSRTTLFLHLMMLREAFGKETITPSLEWNFLNHDLNMKWSFLQIFECFIQIMVDWSFENGTSIVNTEVLYHVSDFFTTIHPSFIQKENKHPILFIKGGNVAVYWLFYYELNTVLLLCPGRFKVNYWELKLELGTNCSK